MFYDGTCPDVAVVQLPRRPTSSAFHTRSEEYTGKTMSVRFNSGLVTSGSDAQLSELLTVQRPHAVVMSSTTSFGGADIQRMADIAGRAVDKVSIVGSFAKVAAWGEAIPIR